MLHPINQTNQTNFKALYIQRGVDYSNSQKDCIQQIETRLYDRVVVDDFYIKPGVEKDTIDLAYVKSVGLDEIEKSDTNNPIIKIGTYSLEKPFYIDELNKVVKNTTRTENLAMTIAGIIVLLLLSTGAIIKSIKSPYTFSQITMPPPFPQR